MIKKLGQESENNYSAMAPYDAWFLIYHGAISLVDSGDLMHPIYTNWKQSFFQV